MTTEANTCRDCGIREGQTHHLGCDTEQCPFCGGQLISCDCCYEQLGLDPRPGTRLYKEGLSHQQAEKWERLLEERGRIPYIRWPIVCAYCGALWPDLFMVPNEEWRRYIEPEMRGQTMCRACYDRIKGLIDAGQGGARRG